MERQRRKSLLLNRLIIRPGSALLCLLCALSVAQAAPQREPFSFGKVDLELWEQINELDKKFEQSGLVYEEKALAAYLDEVGRSLLGPADLQLEHVRWRFRALRSPAVNAFAMPNGSIYVHTGLLARLENEAQLAGVLAHEIIHVRNRHSYLEYRSARKKSVAIHVIGAVEEAFTGLGVVTIASGVFLQLSMFGYSREMEKEADLEGLKRLRPARYDPREMAETFRLMQQEFEVELYRKLPTFYSDHPKLKDRVDYLSRALDQMGEQPPLPTEETGGQRNRYLSRCAAVTRHNVTLAIEAGLYRTALALARKNLEVEANSADNLVSLAQAFAALGPRTAVPTDEELSGKGKGETRKLKKKTTLDEEEQALAATSAGQELRKQNFAEAEKLYLQAVELDAKHADAQRGLGFLYEKMKRPEQAVAAYRKYVDIRPGAMDRLLIMRRIRTLESQNGTNAQPAPPQ